MRATTFGQGCAAAFATALVAIATVLLVGGRAEAQTTTTTTTADPAAAEQPPADETDAPSGDSGSPPRLRLMLENVTPQKIFFKGTAPATFRYEIAGPKARDLVIEVMRKGGSEAVQRWTVENVEPGRAQTQTWGGKTRDKDAARSGAYLFRVREKGGALADRSAVSASGKANGDRSFGYFDHVYPIRGKHTYGDGVGAPRSGHTHQGQDVFADCGVPLEAARAGKVQFRGFQGGGAGYYVVIDGKKTGRDYVYMHLKGKARVAQDDRVRTGQRIGEVGESGNASGCHLHFELWSPPGWYEGGDFLRSVTRQLKRWDRWS